jgi:hypothetical protein
LEKLGKTPPPEKLIISHQHQIEKNYENIIIDKKLL